MRTLISGKLYHNISSFILYNFPKPLFDFAATVRIKWKQFRMPEKRASFGKLNPDKTFFVIRLYPPGVGLMAMYMYVLGAMEYAESKGWIPVIDMQNYETLYSFDGGINNTQNVWEQYFSQPEIGGVRYTLNEVYQSKNVILSNGTLDSLYHGKDATDDILAWQIKQAKKMRFSDDVEKYVEEKYKDIIGKFEKKVLGIALRGGDIKNARGHSIQPSVDMIVSVVNRVNAERQFDCIFVKANDADELDQMKQAIPNIVYSDTNRMRGFNPRKADYYAVSTSNAKGAEIYYDQREYISEIYILSKCDGYIGGHNNGSYVARIWNGNKYESLNIIDCGIYDP